MPDDHLPIGRRGRSPDIREHGRQTTWNSRNKHSATTRRVQLRRITAAGVVVFGLSAFVLAPDAAHAASSTATKSVVISTAKNSKYGTILVSGRTLYTLKPSAVACTAKCLKIWPEVLLPKGVKKATAGTGVSAAKLGTVKRAGGALQVTYSGKALYWFFEDTAAGQVKGVGTDTWGAWSVVVTRSRVLAPAGQRRRRVRVVAEAGSRSLLQERSLHVVLRSFACSLSIWPGRAVRRTGSASGPRPRAHIARLPAGVLDRRGRRRSDRDRLVESLGRYKFCHLDDRSSRE